MKNIIFNIWNYSIRIFKETLFLILFALDVVGVLVTYFTSFSVPYWIFIVIFILAIFLGGFNVYRKGTADIRIEISSNQDSTSCICLSKDDLLFDFAISGFIANFGPQSGLLENVTPKLWANNIRDKYLQRRIFAYKVLPLHKGKINPHLLQDNTSRKIDSHFSFPIVLNPGQIEPYTVGIRLSLVTMFTEDKDEVFKAFTDWLECFEFSIQYTIQQSNGSFKREVSVKIDSSGIKDTFENASRP